MFTRDATDAQFPPKPIDAGESLLSVPRAIADPPLSPPPTNSTSVMCSAAKPAFVEKVEKAGKAAIAGLAASAVIASVR